MEYACLGHTGLQVSRLCLGAMSGDVRIPEAHLAHIDALMPPGTTV